MKEEKQMFRVFVLKNNLTEFFIKMDYITVITGPNKLNALRY